MTTPVNSHHSNRQRTPGILLLCVVWLVHLATLPDAATAAGMPFAVAAQHLTPALSWEADSPDDKTAGGWQDDFSNTPPSYAGWAFGGIVGLLIGVAGMALLLRHQVRMRTRHLEDLNAVLRKSEARLQLISSVTSDYMFYAQVDAYGQLQLDWVAGAFEHITGYTPEEYVARGGWRAAIHSDDHSVDDRDMEALRTGQRAVSEVRLIAKSGELRWVRVYAHPVVDAESGKLTQIYGAVQDITARKLAVEALRESEQRFQRAVADAPFPMMVHAEDGEVLVVNRVWTEITGYSPGELPTIAAWTERAYGARKAQVATDIDRLYGLQGRVDEGEYTITTRSGTQRVWAFSSSPVGRMPDGRRLVLSMAVDVTERKGAEAKLRRNEQLLRLFVEHAPASIAMFDRAMRYIVASRRYLADYGLGDQELTGRSHYDVFPDMPERWKEIHRRCLAGAVERCDDDPFPRQDGSLDWVRWEIRPWYEDSGEMGGIILFSEVITERKRMQQDLAAHADQLSNVLDSITDAFITLDRDWRITYINPEAARINRKHPEEFLGKTHWEEWPASLGTIVEREYQRAMTERVPVHFEHRYYVEGEYDVWLDIHAYPTDEGLALYYRDITERKQAEEELRLSRDRLAALSQRLVEAYETERRAIGRELHDQFGQMLTAMKITLDLAGHLPREAAAKKIAQAQELASELLQRVSRLSLELRPTMLDDLGLVPALLWHVNRYQEQTGIAVAFKHSGAEGKRFDTGIETTAYRIIQEALTNVARHAQATHVALALQVSDGWMEIHMSDDGIGFDPEVALADRRGLAAMRERVQLVGGAFHIESEKGEGTRKLIRLPVTEETP